MSTGSVTVLLILLFVVSPVLYPMMYAAPSRSFLQTRGTSITDSEGRVVILRGVNYPGYDKERTSLHNPGAYMTLELGFSFNVVRLPISWANLEPEPGVFNSTYLSEFVGRDVEWAGQAGLYVVLDMHQYDWAGRFGGYGVPDWAVQNYPANETGMREAVSDFWTNNGLQDHLIQVWVKVAEYFANEPAVAGYDLLNEPWVYTSAMPELNASAVNAFYVRVIQAIRTVDQNHIVFLEPANMYTPELSVTPNIVWSPHFYPLSFESKYQADDFTLLEQDFLMKYQTFVTEGGMPVWIGEFGAFMADESSRATWTQDALTLFERYHVGWAWWAYTGQYTTIPNQLP